MKIIYKAEDGTLFENEQECLKYESLNRKKKALEEAIILIRNFCAKMECPSCPFRDGVVCRFDGIPESWEVED